MRGQPGFFDVDERLKRLSDLGDQLEAFRSAVDFETFRPELNAALSYSDGSQGGRPPLDRSLLGTAPSKSPRKISTSTTAFIESPPLRFSSKNQNELDLARFLEVSIFEGEGR